jgi:hypothetical protein
MRNRRFLGHSGGLRALGLGACGIGRHGLAEDVHERLKRVGGGDRRGLVEIAQRPDHGDLLGEARSHRGRGYELLHRCDQLKRQRGRVHGARRGLGSALGDDREQRLHHLRVRLIRRRRLRGLGLDHRHEQAVGRRRRGCSGRATVSELVQHLGHHAEKRVLRGRRGRRSGGSRVRGGGRDGSVRRRVAFAEDEGLRVAIEREPFAARARGARHRPVFGILGDGLVLAAAPPLDHLSPGFDLARRDVFRTILHHLIARAPAAKAHERHVARFCRSVGAREERMVLEPPSRRREVLGWIGRTLRGFGLVVVLGRSAEVFEHGPLP